MIDEPLAPPSPGEPATAADQTLVEDGVLLIDKPASMTSHTVVDKVRRWLRVRKAGHCGTLDPFATGLLVVCVNRATRIADLLTGDDKVYRFEMQLGVETDTHDPTGEEIRRHQGAPVAREDFAAVLERFRGSILQEVPAHAAVKVRGRRLYEWTRSGVDVERPSRRITIHRLELVHYHWPLAVLDLRCSKGTYVRRLAADIGNMLGCGAHVTRLTRLASGPFHLDAAVSMEEVQSWRAQPQWQSRLIPIHRALDHLPRIIVEDEHLRRRLRQGILDPVWEEQHRQAAEAGDLPVRLVSPEGGLLALWRPAAPDRKRQLRVFS